MPRALIPLIAITFVDVLGFTILIPLLPYYAQLYGATPTTIAAIYATVAGCTLLSAPIWGRLSDRLGRRDILTVSQCAAFLGFAILASGTALWTIFLARAIEGLGGGTLGVTQAYVTDVTLPEQRPRAFALLGATYGLGFLVGPVLAGGLVGFGYHVPFLVAAGLALATVVMTRTLLPDRRGALPEPASFAELRASLREPVLGRLLGAGFAFAIAFTAWITVFALFAQQVLHFGPRDSAGLFVVSSLVSVGVQIGAIGRLVDRFGAGRVALAGFFCSGCAYAAVAFVRTPLALYAMVVPWSLGGALLRPTLGSLLAGTVPADRRGAILGLNEALANLAFLLAPFAATAVLRVDPRLSGVVPLAFTFVAAAIGGRVLTGARAATAAEA